jgi:lipocalin
MMYGSNYRRVALAALLSLTVSLALSAQSTGGSAAANKAPSTKPITVQDSELKRFASTLNDVHSLQVDFQKSFQKAVTSSPLGQTQFLNIYRTERTAHKLPPNLSTAQKRQYQQLVSTVVAIERNAEKEMVATVKKDGFTVSRFDEIVRAVHTDTTLADRLQKVRKAN